MESKPGGPQSPTGPPLDSKKVDIGRYKFFVKYLNNVMMTSKGQKQMNHQGHHVVIM